MREYYLLEVTLDASGPPCLQWPTTLDLPAQYVKREQAQRETGAEEEDV